MFHANNFNLTPSKMYRNYNSFSTPKPYLNPETPKKFPEDIECIIKSSNPDAGSLYISNIQAASNPNTLKKLRIGAVLSCAKGYQLSHSPSLIPHYKYIPTQDHEKCDISVHFDQAVDFISEKLKKTNILVHCIAGVSRSVSMVLAYFIREHNMRYDQAYQLVKAKRRIIHPNDGFIKQLKEYSERIKSKTPKKRENQDSYTKERSTLAKSVLVSKSTYDKQNDNVGLTRMNTVTPKRQPYLNDINQISEFKSVDITNKQTKQYYQPNYQDYKSSEYIKYETVRQKQQKLATQKTATDFYTPTKGIQQTRHKYDTIQSTKINRMALSPNQKRRDREVTPDKYKIAETSQPARGSLYQNMSNQLNEKIEMIRKKYNSQRQKLYDQYQRQDPHQNNRTKVNTYNTAERVMQARGASADYLRTAQATIQRANTALETKAYRPRDYYDRNQPTATNLLNYNYQQLQNPTTAPYYHLKSRETGYVPRKYDSNTGYDRYQTLLPNRTYNNYSPLYQPSNYHRYQY